MLPFPLSSDGMNPKSAQRRGNRPSAFGMLGAGAGGQAMTHWYRILQMLPRARRGGLPPSHQPRQLGGKDMARTRMRGLFGTLGIAPWG
jgi:hypothetical protein